MLRKIIMVTLALSAAAVSAETITRSDVIDRIEGMWLGQIVANMAGRATEGKYSGSYPNPAESVPWVLKGPEESWPADDDTDIEYIALDTLETCGINPSAGQLASQWLDHITSSGIYISNRQAWYLMGDGFLPPETGSRNYNMHWYSIDCQITNEIIGAINPGLAQHAIETTRKFALMSNEGFPVHAAQFYSCMYSNAYFQSDIRTLIDEALEIIPHTSRSYQVVQDVLTWYDEDMLDGTPDWRSLRQKLYDYYGSGPYAMGRYYNWIESTVNLGATVMSLLYGGGDYKETVQIGILAGWDCDCNPATAGGIIGIINGRSGLPQDLFGPDVCSNVYSQTYRVNLPLSETIESIANRAADIAEINIVANGGTVTVAEDDYIYDIPLQNSLSGDFPVSQSDGPKGLVAEALTEGIDVSPDAAKNNQNPDNDRYNLNSIIDGVATNVHNGVRPYWSYGSEVDRDWYSLNFSQPVIINSVTFYEGDIVWGGINTYVASDSSRGGYFEDLTVEFLDDGQYVEVSGLIQSEPLIRTKMYQIIRFDFDSVITSSVRIIGTAGGSQKYTTILELEAGGSVDTFYGDFDKSGSVDNLDFAVLALNWGYGGSAAVDYNDDGFIDSFELIVFAENWMSTR
ncbi:ADP-ribosylglycohydrolase [Limihaloglobus sulfuriphilus]|uniref:ADP-ribosylglycohydrolase n=1 Tax=Limihaloglobus sulfuriphilus TaxID=1851148 RepID=A0A1Q2MIU1_9BACT|nr:ADP-ribosylglycohydrolase family protein [Limihaloglobus sulfuriphilus]AQQ72227.1 ADP-ribosylglycohydrolase [Limihaloglobus sulfuriphilus]